MELFRGRGDGKGCCLFLYWPYCLRQSASGKFSSELRWKLLFVDLAREGVLLKYSFSLKRRRRFCDFCDVISCVEHCFEILPILAPLPKHFYNIVIEARTTRHSENSTKIEIRSYLLKYFVKQITLETSIVCNKRRCKTANTILPKTDFGLVWIDEKFLRSQMEKKSDKI